jgi:hypothetical protein
LLWVILLRKILYISLFIEGIIVDLPKIKITMRLMAENAANSEVIFSFLV